jgi:hypothetical protein
MRDELGALYQDEIFSDLFPEHGCPAMAPGRLAMITIFHFAEGLSGRAAADAVRSRIDLKAYGEFGSSSFMLSRRMFAFLKRDCSVCPSISDCTNAQPYHEALQEA